MGQPVNNNYPVPPQAPQNEQIEEHPYQDTIDRVKSLLEQLRAMNAQAENETNQ